MRVIGPFKIDNLDVILSSTLTRKDIGRWALMVQGCYQFFKNEAAAAECKRQLESNP